MSREPRYGLAPEVERFLRTHIDSVEQLEVVLLLRSDPTRCWTANDVVSALRTSPGSAAARLQDLTRRGVLRATTSPPGFRFDPIDAGLHGVVEQVAEAYRERRVTVIAFIYSRPPDAVRELARAFRVKGDDDDDVP